ncbi:DUF6602 domain-containing protein [Bacillus cereus]|uniref:DUF6602 domain-containing protein n=1 Tax=Bacillus cereus TaxID=1396 RepID=UPI000C28EB47|nr:DUF6602 domain-containing protein [Bacillus cereus]
MFNFSNDSLVQHVEKMSAEIKLIKQLEHNGEKGREAEGILKNFLNEMLPKKVTIGTGFVIDNSGRNSNQLDIMLYDGHETSPIFQGYENSVIHIESVFATIETKLTYSNSKKVVLTAQKSANKVKRISLKDVETEELLEQVSGEVDEDNAKIEKHEEYKFHSRYYPYTKKELLNQHNERELPLCVLFAYSSKVKKLETIISYLNNKKSLSENEQKKPYYPALDLICILDMGIIVREEGKYVSFFSLDYKTDKHKVFNTFYYLLNHHIDKKKKIKKDYISTWFTSFLRSNKKNED